MAIKNGMKISETSKNFLTISTPIYLELVVEKNERTVVLTICKDPHLVPVRFVCLARNMQLENGLVISQMPCRTVGRLPYLYPLASQRKILVCSSIAHACG
jgi:hypothetical protein